MSPCEHRQPVGELRRAARGCRAAAASRLRSCPSGRRSATSAIIEMVEQLGVELLDLGQVEMRRRAAEMREVEAVGELVEAGDRLDRLRGAEPREQRQQGHRLDARPRAAPRPRSSRAASTTCPRPRPAAPRARTAGGCGAQRVEHLQLDGAVRDMVLAAHDVGDVQVDVVDHAGQQVEPAAVGAADDRVADQQFGSKCCGPRTRSVHSIGASWSSLKRQCGATPSGTGAPSGLRS